MAEYIDKEKLIHNLKKWSDVSPKINERNNDFIKILKDEPTANVVEREKIDNAIEEIEQTLYVDSLIFGELIDFKDGKISADDVIEEFNRVTRIEVLEILKRNIGESK